MIKFFKNRIKGFLDWVNEDRNTQYTLSSGASIKSSQSCFDENKGTKFTIFSAEGGKVIQVSSYDQHIDRFHSKLYIVTDKEDLGEELALIITRESLTR